MRKVILTDSEMDVLFRQDPATKGDGGWQSLLVKLQRKCNRLTGELNLSPIELEKIPRYAFDYKNGGWENRLKAIFSRTLGTRLGRP